MDFLADWGVFAPTLVYLWLGSANIIAYYRTRRFSIVPNTNAKLFSNGISFFMFGMVYTLLVSGFQTFTPNPITWVVYLLYLIYPLLYNFLPLNRKIRIIGYNQPLDLYIFRKPELKQEQVTNQNLVNRNNSPALYLILGAMLLCTTISILGFGAQTCGWLDTSLGYSGCVRQITIGGKAIQSVKYSPDGTILAIGGSDALLQLVNVADGNLIRELKGHQDWIDALAFSPAGKMLASASWDKTVKLWNVQDGSLIRTINPPGEYSSNLAFSPDGSLLATGAYNTGVRIWQISDGMELKILPDAINKIAFSPDGTFLATYSHLSDNDFGLILWRVKDWSKAATFSGLKNYILGIAFTPDGQQLIASDGNIFVWKVADGLLVRKIEDKTDIVAFSPKGNLLVSEVEKSKYTLNSPNYFKLWDIQTGQKIKDFGKMQNIIYDLDFSSDGQTVAAASSRDIVRLWKVKPST